MSVEISVEELSVEVVYAKEEKSELHIQTLISVGEYSVVRQSRRELQYNQSLGNPDASHSMISSELQSFSR
ncbi:hypothetical protein F511_44588 [Dorcoceras hygrometricum]|uniref:Uncharacterized protein n=1 Tax=Dorcoceras hygrometricum TaxID=472368 RepID=A0A2Z7AB60_9LAMI|nr:hypothetical protein F511_44588 [Dorcoceras hygrometricum]